MDIPDYQLETELRARGYLRIAGVDEVGRGPLAGPVMAAAVILGPDAIPPGLRDSKQLTAKRRTALAEQLRMQAEVSVGQASVEEIEFHNILRAAHLAMRRAVEALDPPPDFLLIDGNMVPEGLTIPAQPLVRGDTRSVSVAAASIVAKTRRDRLMVDLAQQHPEYGWDHNMGYPTKEHRLALQNLGPTPHHRRSFRPVHKILYQG